MKERLTAWLKWLLGRPPEAKVEEVARSLDPPAPEHEEETELNEDDYHALEIGIVWRSGYDAGVRAVLERQAAERAASHAEGVAALRAAIEAASRRGSAPPLSNGHDPSEDRAVLAALRTTLQEHRRG